MLDNSKNITSNNPKFLENNEKHSIFPLKPHLDSLKTIFLECRPS